MFLAKITNKGASLGIDHILFLENHGRCRKQGGIHDFSFKRQLLFEAINRFSVLKTEVSKKQLNISNGSHFRFSHQLSALKFCE